MTVSLKHAFNSPKADGTDTTLVQPSNWNAEHVITLSAGKVVGRDSSGAGAAIELPIAVDATLQSMIPPSGNTAQRPATAAAGMMRYNTSTSKFEGYTSAWGTLGGGCTISDSAPSSPVAGDLWWKSDEGQMYVYYTDSDTSQWVVANAFAGANGYLPLIGGTMSGTLNFGGTGSRLTGDWSNSTLINRVVLKTNTVNGNTGIYATPDGTGTTSGMFFSTDYLLTSGSEASMQVIGGSDVRISSGREGSGTYLPMTFYTNNTQQMNIATDGTITSAKSGLQIVTGSSYTFTAVVITGTIIAGSTTMNVSSVSGGSIVVGMVITGTNVISGTVVTALGTGTGAAGSYTVSAAPLVTTTGTLTSVGYEFYNMPTWSKRISLLFTGVSGSATSPFLVQLGNGSTVTTGYVGSAIVVASATADTTGFLVTQAATAASNVTGVVTLINVTGNTWLENGSLAYNTASGVHLSGGYIALSSVLDRIRILNVNGTDQFDAGSVTLMYE